MDIKQVSDIHTTANSVRVLLLKANTDIKKQFFSQHKYKTPGQRQHFFCPTQHTIGTHSTVERAVP